MAITEEDFLNKVAANLGRKRKSSDQVPPVIYENHPWEDFHNKNQEEYLQLFIKNVSMQGGRVIQISRDEIDLTVRTILSEENIKQVAMWDDHRLSELGLEEILAREKVTFISSTNKSNEKDLKEEIENSQLGITWADGAFAETGTTMLLNGHGKGRLVSLLPNYHLVFLKESQIEPRLSEAMQKMKVLTTTSTIPACVNFISGPSSSADIALENIFGVHGPKNYIVCLLKNE